MPLPSKSRAIVRWALVSERGSTVTSTAARMGPSTPRTPQWCGGSKLTSSAVSGRSEKPDASRCLTSGPRPKGHWHSPCDR